MKLHPKYLTIALLPVLTFFISDRLLDVLGAPGNASVTLAPTFPGHQEFVARLAVLGGLILFAAISVAAVTYFAVTVARLEKQAIQAVLGTFLTLAVVTALLTHLLPTRDTENYLGSAFVQGAFDAADKLAGAECVGKALVQDDCIESRTAILRSLFMVYEILIIVGVASLVMGSICCLAEPAGNDDAAKLPALEQQSSSLNLYLYLSAAFLVSGLVVAGALLKWPVYLAAEPAKSDLNARVNALIGFFGVIYTVILSAFYVPVAAILAARVGAIKGDAAAKPLPDAFTGPLQVLKIVAALGSSAIAGALPGVLGLR